MVWAEDGELQWLHAKAMQAPVDHCLQMLDEGYYAEQGLPPVRVGPDGEFLANYELFWGDQKLEGTGLFDWVVIDGAVLTVQQVLL